MLLAYSLTSLTVFLLVVALWQWLAARAATGGTDLADQRAARRTATVFAGVAVLTGLAAGAVRLLA